MKNIHGRARNIARVGVNQLRREKKGYTIVRSPGAVHVPRYTLLAGRAYFYGVSPSSNSRHSAATERNYHIGARVQAGKRTLFVLRLDLLRPSFAFLHNPLLWALLSLSLNRSRF